MEFVWNSNVTEIIGDDKKVTGVKVNNNKTGEDSEIAVDGVFIYVGINPITKPFSNLGITDENGWIETNDHMETKVPGILQSVMFVRKIYAKLRRRLVKAELPVKAFTLISLL